MEKAESRLQTEAVTTALRKARLQADGVDYIFAGDLLNQCISSTFGLRSLDIPFLGQYGGLLHHGANLGFIQYFCG